MIDADNDVHVIDRANAWSALRDCDFERAVELFENIIFKEPENHEAYWGRALASAGIVYVTDLNENKRVPTCNNIREESFVDSNDVKRAIALAPEDIAGTYKKQAAEIEAIRVEWVKKASREKPYDVFICFKDSDREHNIERTDDSYDAHELYNALTEEGYKVFFSRVSLRDKVSEHYEPYIYNALKTAKVMIVFGEKAEYFNAVWVKNEWTRYRAMIERGEKHRHSMVVVYKNITPADLPAGLRSRQCLDASEMKFFDMLRNHINKVVNAPKEKTIADEYVPTPPPPKKRRWQLIAIISGILALAIALGVIVPNLADSKAEETTASTEQIGLTAETENDYGLKYTLNDDKASYSVTGVGSFKGGELVIPSKYNGLPVTSIGSSAFYECSSLTGVVMGDSVTSIGGSAFNGCSSLTSVVIPDSVTSIDGYAFWRCSSLTSIEIPDRVKSIGDYTFRDCSRLTSVTIGDSVTSIGDWAFEGCSSLTLIKYRGSEAEWKAITKGFSGVDEDNCTIIFNYQGE